MNSAHPPPAGSQSAKGVTEDGKGESGEEAAGGAEGGGSLLSLNDLTLSTDNIRIFTQGCISRFPQVSIFKINDLLHKIDLKLSAEKSVNTLF